MAQFENQVPYHAWGSRDLFLRAPELIGTDVKVFQTLFNVFLRHSSPRLGPIGQALHPTGIFDAATETAVRQWQSYFHLKVDGVIGPATVATLGQHRSAYGGPPFGSRYIDTIGESGGDVVVLQSRLNGYRYGRYTGVPATGVFDAGTRDAVRQLQRDLNRLGIDPGVPIDGLVRPETFDAIVTGTFLGGRTLHEGRHGLDSLWLQRFLRARGYYTGILDGLFGAETAKAVKTFQAGLGLEADGAVGQLTIFHIGRIFKQPVSSWPSS